MCGYDDPIRLMNAIKIYLYTQYMMQKQNKLEHIITHNTNKSTVNISEKLKNKSYIQKLPISYDKHLSKFEAPIVEVSAAAGGGSFAHAFRVLLISALIIVLILLLCKIMKSNHPYMLEDSQYSADLQTSIPINWYY